MGARSNQNIAVGEHFKITIDDSHCDNDDNEWTECSENFNGCKIEIK